MTTPLEQAAKDFLASCLEVLCDNAGRFTCEEAATVVALFEAADDYEGAVEFLDHHADGDDDESDMHHDVFLKRQEVG